MTRMFRAELSKLTRRRVLAATAIALLVASVVATTVVFLSAEPELTGPPARGATLEELAAAGGGTEAFSIGVSFAGFFTFVLFIANVTGEFSQGTFRTLLMKQPRRFPLLAGKLAGLLAFAAGVLLVGEVTTWIFSLAFAPSQDVSSSAWFSVSALREGVTDYATALLGLSAWATFGTALALLVRSTPIALAIGIAWAGPFEHITQEAWSAASGVYPGLLLEALAVGGTSDVSYERAVLLTMGYVAVAIVAGALSFTRRDIAG